LLFQWNQLQEQIL